MGKTKVVNLRKYPYEIYIGRGSKWGNPHKIGVGCDRMTSIRRYFDDLRKNQKLIDGTVELQGKILGCYCAPLPCHGHILATLADGEEYGYRTVEGKVTIRRSNINA